MKKFLIFLLISFANANFSCKISKIPEIIKVRMQVSGSYKYKCPVKLKDLRYIKVKHWDFRGNEQNGELIVNKKIANSVCNIFKSLYKIKYPIEKIHLISDYNADEQLSMKVNNTTAFYCKKLKNSSKYSIHSYGLAIDINPLINPFISLDGKISPVEGAQYIKRAHIDDSFEDKAKLVNGDKAIEIFQLNGFIWGGNWESLKDYKHFEFQGKLRPKELFKALQNGMF